MSVFTVRRAVAAASMALVAATLATPASAHDLDEPDINAIAAKLCPAGTSTAEAYDSESADSGDRAEVDLYTYGSSLETEATGDPVSLCTFAIISTDEDSKLNGTYTLNVGAAAISGGISGNDVVTKAIATPFDATSNATINASGQQLTSKTTAQKKAAKVKHKKATKAAKATYVKTVKAAKKKFAKAGKTSKAKKAMSKKIAAAKMKYRAALANADATQKRQTSPTERDYSLKLTLPFAS